ncbi:MAG: hypothetical protein QG673_2072 [Pseudomonadota bacterium]|nr:hypothetical protein [Pseudomonadota bacterium]
MIAFAAGSYFSAVDGFQELRKAKFTEDQAEVIIKIFEQQQQSIQVQKQSIQEQKTEIETIKAHEPVTKKDLEITKLELQKEMEVIRKEIEVVRKEIEVVRKEIAILKHDTLRFVIWTGCGTAAVIIGVMYTMFKLMLH